MLDSYLNLDLNYLQKWSRVEVAKEMLDYVAEVPTFIRHIMNAKETKVYEYDVEILRQYSERRYKNESKSKKPKVSKDTEGNEARLQLKASV